MKSRAWIAIGLTLGLSLAPLASATVVLALDLGDLASLSPLVLTGEVNRIESTWNTERTKIYTRVWISPDEVLKGPAQTGTLTLKLLGGQVGDTVALMPGAPRFETGERVLVFLEPRKDGDGHLTVGQYQGKFQIFVDPSTGQDRAVRDVPEPGVQLVGPGAGPDQAQSWSLDEVRRIVERVGGAQ